MQVEGFRAYAWANYGIKLTLEEAEKMRNAFFELYPGLLDFHGRQRDVGQPARDGAQPARPYPAPADHPQPRPLR